MKSLIIIILTLGICFALSNLLDLEYISKNWVRNYTVIALILMTWAIGFRYAYLVLIKKM